MLELLTAGNQRYRLPWPGPGSELVERGNLKDGYAGNVEKEHLPIALDIVAPLGTPNSPTYPFSMWGKFVVNDKVLFIPNVQISLTQSKSFVDVWNAAMAYEQYEGIPEYNGEPLAGLQNVTQGFRLSHRDRNGIKWDYCARLITEDEARTIFRHIYQSGPLPHDVWAPELGKHSAASMMTSTLEGDKVLFRPLATWDNPGTPTAITVTGTPFIILELLYLGERLEEPANVTATTLTDSPVVDMSSEYLNRSRRTVVSSVTDLSQSTISDETAPLSKSRYSRVSSISGFFSGITFTSE